MIKIYQTRHKTENQRGNCMQSTIASLLGYKLDDVIDFVKQDKPLESLITYVKSNGYTFNGILYNPFFKKYTLNYNKGYFDKLNEYNGINGLFYATVFSPTHYKLNGNTSSHAVIIDKQFNIVHDPNIKYKDLKNYPEAKQIGYNGLISIALIS